MNRHTFFIDKITNIIEDAITGQIFDTDVIPIAANNLKEVLKKHGWRFNWKSECKYENRALGHFNIVGQATQKRRERLVCYNVTDAPMNIILGLST